MTKQKRGEKIWQKAVKKQSEPVYNTKGFEYNNIKHTPSALIITGAMYDGWW